MCKPLDQSSQRCWIWASDTGGPGPEQRGHRRQQLGPLHRPLFHRFHPSLKLYNLLQLFMFSSPTLYSLTLFNFLPTFDTVDHFILGTLSSLNFQDITILILFLIDSLFHPNHSGLTPYFQAYFPLKSLGLHFNCTSESPWSFETSWYSNWTTNTLSNNLWRRTTGSILV